MAPAAISINAHIGTEKNKQVQIQTQVEVSNKI